MFSISSKYSFQEIRDVYKLILETRPGEATTVVLVANKTDLNGFREVTEAEAREYAEKRGWPFIEISCKTAEGVDEALAKTVRTIDDRDKKKWEDSIKSPRRRKE